MKVLYVCKANISRSQMAEALHKNRYHKDEIKSAGTTTIESLRNKTLKEIENLGRCYGIIPIMKEIGFYVSKNN